MPGSRKGFEKLNAGQSGNFLEFLKMPFYPDGWPVVEVGTSVCFVDLFGEKLSAIGSSWDYIALF